MAPITLFDPVRQYASRLDALSRAARRVIESGRYILGPEVECFEAEAAEFLGVDHAVGVSSGSDALVVALRALGVGAGDEVVTPAYSFIATSEAVRRIGACPVFVDVRADTYVLEVSSVRHAITEKTRAVIGVHLFGQPCDAAGLRALCDSRGLVFIEDAAQAFGGEMQRGDGGLRIGCAGHAACFSFFPAKVLGAFGDAGLATTNDPVIASYARSLRQHAVEDGEARATAGNFRLDALQAALLRILLPDVHDAIARRRAVAERFDAAFCQLPGARVPTVGSGANHVYAAYSLAVPAPMRNRLRKHLAARGIETAVYYSKPLHLQAANADLGYAPGSFPVAERLSRELLALPVHPALSADQVSQVIDAVRSGMK